MFDYSSTQNLIEYKPTQTNEYTQIPICRDDLYLDPTTTQCLKYPNSYILHIDNSTTLNYIKYLIKTEDEPSIGWVIDIWVNIDIGIIKSDFGGLSGIMMFGENMQMYINVSDDYAHPVINWVVDGVIILSLEFEGGNDDDIWMYFAFAWDGDNVYVCCCIYIYIYIYILDICSWRNTTRFCTSFHV